MWKQLGKAGLRFLLSLSAAGLVAIGAWEGYRSLPYQDQAGVWTDGYGNTEDVVPGVAVTEPQARAKMQEHVSRKASAIDKMLTRPATQGQSDAYQSLAYNIGVEAFRRSSVLRHHNAGNFRAACDAILLYNKIRINGVLTYSRGLANRRAAEHAMCLKDLP